MKTKTLLKQAANCKSDEDLRALYRVMLSEFAEKGPLKHLLEANADMTIEKNGPYVRFELNKEISGSYVVAIIPEIRCGSLVVVVALNHMQDGLGMGSQEWDIEDEDVIDSWPERTISDLCKRAKELACRLHAQLIENVGVPNALAASVARKSF